MTEYMGVDVPDDAHGVLQDVHWSGRSNWLLPTCARQRHLRAALGPGARRSPTSISSSNASSASCHRGSARTCRNGRSSRRRRRWSASIGGGIDPGPYLRYLKDKLGGIYGIRAETGARSS